MADVARLTTIFDADVSGLNRGLQQANDKLRNFGSQLTSLGASMSAAITAPLVALGVAAVKTATDFDSLKRGLVAVSGSAQAAEAQFKSLREVAKLPGLGLKEALQGSINLQAAGLSAQLAERSLKGFGNALATVGKGKAELDGVNTALSQIVSKGKVSAEEINQLAERLPQIRKLMQSAFGTADTEALQKRGLQPTAFIEAIVKELEKLPQVTGGAKNAFENLSDTIQIALLPLGNALLGPIVKAIESVTPLIEQLSAKFAGLSPNLQSGIIGFGAFAAVLGPAIVALGAVAAAIGAIGLPVAAVVAGVAALGAAFAFNLGGIRDSLVDLAQKAAPVWEMLKAAGLEAFNAIKMHVESVLPDVKDFIVSALELILAVVKQTLRLIRFVWNEDFGYLRTITVGILTVIQEAFRVSLQTINATLKIATALINGEWAKGWQVFKDIAANAFDYVVNLSQRMGEEIYRNISRAIVPFLRLKDFADSMTDWLNGRLSGIPTPSVGALPPASAGAGAAPSRFSLFSQAPEGGRGGATGTGGGKGPSIDLPLTGQDTTATVGRMLAWMRDVERKTQAMLSEAKDRLRQAADKTMGTSAFFDQAGRLIIPVNTDLLIQQGLEDPGVKLLRDVNALRPFVDMGKDIKAATEPAFNEMAIHWRETMHQMVLDLDDILAIALEDVFMAKPARAFEFLLRSFQRLMAQLAVEATRAALASRIAGNGTGGGIFGKILGAAAGFGLSLLGGGGLGGIPKPPTSGNILGHVLPKRDSGGPVSAFSAFANMGVPEVFVPHASGFVATADQVANAIQKKGGMGGQPIVVNVNVTTPDARSFQQSRDQIASEMWAGLQRAAARNA